MTFLLLLSSCSLFKKELSLQNLNKIKLLNAVKLTGEGTGRITLGERQYLFGVDSILRENFDWVLAVAIPLHGEEVMILPDLKQKQASFEETESFELRIDNEFKKIKLNQVFTSGEFISGLRSLIRFNLSPNWGTRRNCKVQQKNLVCFHEGEKFLVSTTDRELIISKSLGQGRSLALNAKNLTESFFEQSDIRLYSNEADSLKKKSSFSLELFWKK